MKHLIPTVVVTSLKSGTITNVTIWHCCTAQTNTNTLHTKAKVSHGELLKYSRFDDEMRPLITVT